MNSVDSLKKLKQSIWLDNISREFLSSEKFAAKMRELAITGLTSNPTIFEKAIVETTFYDKSIKKLAKFDISAEDIFESLMIEDLQKVSDYLYPTYNQSGGKDGYASIEISPKLARNAQKTVQEAKALFGRLKKRNIMIKVPATEEGLKAIKTLIAEGINVNATLIFSVERYKKLMQTYAEGLKIRISKKLPINNVFSVASFFVSRIDTMTDAKLRAIIKQRIRLFLHIAPMEQNR